VFLVALAEENSQGPAILPHTYLLIAAVYASPHPADHRHLSGQKQPIETFPHRANTLNSGDFCNFTQTPLRK